MGMTHQVNHALKDLSTKPLNSLVAQIAKTSVRELDGLKEKEAEEDEEAEADADASAHESESD